MKLFRRTYTSHTMGTEVNLMVVTTDKDTGDEALRSAVRDLEETEQALSRFRQDSDLSLLNREGRFRCDTISNNGHPRVGWRLLAAVKAATDAYEWSEGLLDPRVIDSLEVFGYGKSLPRQDVGYVPPGTALEPVDMGAW